MSKTDIFPYPGREGAYITVATIKEPYGPGSSPVVSIGCTLKGDTDNPTWKVHVPMDLLEIVSHSLYTRSPLVRAQKTLERGDERQRIKAYRERMDGELRAIQQMINRRDDHEE